MTSDTTTTLGAALSGAAHRWGDAPFILHGDAVTSYAELEHASRRAAAGLMRLGLEPGDRIGLLAPNRIEWLILFFAAVRVGVAVVAVRVMLSRTRATLRECIERKLKPLKVRP